MSIITLFRKTFRTLWGAPLLYLLIQLPQAIIDALEYYAEQVWGESQTLLMGGFALLAFIIGVIPSVITFAMVWKESRTLGAVLRFFHGKWGLILLSALVSGILFALGVMAYIIPGILLMTLYLFVPYLILTEEKAPLTTYFYRSSKLSRKKFKTVLAVVGAVLGLFIIFQKVGEALGVHASEQLENPLLQKILLTSILMLFSMFINAFVNVWLSHFFLRLNADEETV